MTRPEKVVLSCIAVALYGASVLYAPWDVVALNGYYVTHAPVWSQLPGARVQTLTLAFEWVTIALTLGLICIHSSRRQAATPPTEVEGIDISGLVGRTAGGEQDQL